MVIDGWQKYQEYGYRHRFYIQALTQGQLVYLRTLKCASTFFYNNFIKWGWQEIHFKDIDWTNQTVFSHFMDPVQRRHKGIAEYISMTNTHDLLFNDVNFQSFLACVPVLDKHSVSLHGYYGEHAWMIDWVPLVSDHSDNIAQTEKILAYGSCTTKNKWDSDHVHRSDSKKKQIEHKIIDLWNNSDTLEQDYTKLYLERDIALWQTVQKDYCRSGQDWKSSSWLRHRLRYQ